MHKASTILDKKPVVHYVVAVTNRAYHLKRYVDGVETLYCHQQSLMARLRKKARNVYPLTLFTTSKKPILARLTEHRDAKVVLHWVVHGVKTKASLYERIDSERPLFVKPEQAVSFFVARGLPRDVSIHFKVNACFSGVTRLGGSVALRVARAFAVAGYPQIVVRGYLGEVSDGARHSYCRVYYPRTVSHGPLPRTPQLPIEAESRYTIVTTRASVMSVDYPVVTSVASLAFRSVAASRAAEAKSRSRVPEVATPWLDAVKRGIVARAASEAVKCP